MKVKDAAQHRIVSSSGLGVPPLRVESLDEAALVLLPDELRRPSSPESQSEHRTRPKSKAISVEAFPTDAVERAKAKHKMLQAMNPDHAVERQRKKFEVEQHFDDCGIDDSSLLQGL